MRDGNNNDGGIGYKFLLCFCHPTGIVFLDGLVRSFFRCFIWSDVVATFSHKWLEQFCETDREYSLASADDPIRFWRSRVKVTAGHWGQILWTTLQHGCVKSASACYWRLTASTTNDNDDDVDDDEI